MKKISKKEKVLNSKRQLHEFLKLQPEERLKNFYKLKHAVLRLYSILFTNGIPAGFDFDRLSSDHLFLDIELIPFFKNTDNTISYVSFKNATNLIYPTEAYEIIEPSCGLYKSNKTNERYFSKRLAVDYTLEAYAQRWYKLIPEILNLLDNTAE